MKYLISEEKYPIQVAYHDKTTMCSMFAGGPINYLLDKTQNNKHTVGQQKDCTSRLCHVSV